MYSAHLTNKLINQSISQLTMMEQKEKKQYEKPRITRIKLDARTAVLGICKTSGAGGPTLWGCVDALSDPCNVHGS